MQNYDIKGAAELFDVLVKIAKVNDVGKLAERNDIGGPCGIGWLTFFNFLPACDVAKNAAPLVDFVRKFGKEGQLHFTMIFFASDGVFECYSDGRDVDDTECPIDGTDVLKMIAEGGIKDYTKFTVTDRPSVNVGEDMTNDQTDPEVLPAQGDGAGVCETEREEALPGLPRDE